MDLVQRQRIIRIERQIQYLYEHLGIDPAGADDVRPPVPPEVYEHARAGKTIRAIQAFCEATGADLATATAFVASLPRSR